MTNLDDMEPWERYEYLKRQQETGDLSEAEEQLSAFWKQLLLGTFTGKEYGASWILLTRLMKVISDADLLLVRLCGLGAVHIGLRFDPKLGQQQVELAQQIEERENKAIDPSILESLQQLVEQAYDDDVPSAPLTPHFLFLALSYWQLGCEFDMARYPTMLKELFRTNFAELVSRLHLSPEPAVISQRIDQLAALPVKITAPVFVRFENAYDQTASPDFGPYVWIEIIHNELKVAPTGRHLATLLFNGAAPVWQVADPSVPAQQYFTNLIIGPAQINEPTAESPP